MQHSGKPLTVRRAKHQALTHVKECALVEESGGGRCGAGGHRKEVTRAEEGGAGGENGQAQDGLAGAQGQGL